MINSEHIKPMDSPFLPLDEILRLLKRQGYTERFLDLNHNPGMIASTLKRAVAAVASTMLPTCNIEHFILDIPGRFDNRQDYVSFSMHMRFDPSSEKIRIRWLAAKLNPIDSTLPLAADSKKLYFIQHTRNITHAAQVYEDLRQARTLNVLVRYPLVAKSISNTKSIHL